MKNPFKKSSIVDTLVNVGVGGAANVAIDYVMGLVDTIASLDATTQNAIKIALGAVGGSMVSNRYLRAAADGVATVGVSNLIDGYVNTDSSTNTQSGASGLPYGTIGRVRMGQHGFARRGKVAGVGEAATAFMSK